MDKTTKAGTKKPEPKHAAPKLSRKERRQGWASLSKGNEHERR